jgi:hypothetical protein
MNERIRELLLKAGWDGYEALDERNQKFAELIVAECMDVARQQRNPANLNYKPSERFVEDLRQHFGVKE